MTIGEIGGAGRHLAYLDNKYNFKKLTGIDLYVDENLNHPKIKFHEGDFDGELPVENNTVQFLVMMMVIEHLLIHFKTLKELTNC